MLSQRYYVEQWEVESFTSPGKIYKVSRRQDGGMECSCPSWIFQRKRLPNGHCKHIRFILANRPSVRPIADIERKRKPVTIQNEEFKAELTNGRIKGFIDSLE